MTTITVSHTISMGHRLPSYKGVCRNLHGHNMRVEVEVKTETFIDFKAVKARLQGIIEPMDHAMVLQVDDPIASVLASHGFAVYGTKEEPTTEFLAQHIFHGMGAFYSVVRVTVFETDKYSATFRG